MFTTVFSAAVYGLQAYLVRVEVDLAGGLPSFQLVGSLGSEVKESRERVSVAMKNSGFQIPPAHITVNLAPAGRRKDGTAFDLWDFCGIWNWYRRKRCRIHCFWENWA